MFFMFNITAEFYVEQRLLCEAYLLHVVDTSFPSVLWFCLLAFFVKYHENALHGGHILLSIRV